LAAIKGRRISESRQGHLTTETNTHQADRTGHRMYCAPRMRVGHSIHLKPEVLLPRLGVISTDHWASHICPRHPLASWYLQNTSLGDNICLKPQSRKLFHRKISCTRVELAIDCWDREGEVQCV
jgi:hypothetical protein